MGKNTVKAIALAYFLRFYFTTPQTKCQGGFIVLTVCVENIALLSFKFLSEKSISCVRIRASYMYANKNLKNGDFQLTKHAFIGKINNVTKKLHHAFLRRYT